MISVPKHLIVYEPDNILSKLIVALYSFNFAIYNGLTNNYIVTIHDLLWFIENEVK
jgi:hypothetical protein